MTTKKKAKAVTTKKVVEQEDASTDDEKVTTKKKAKAVSKEESEEKASPKKKSGYIYFCKHNREGVKTENPSMKAQDITRTLAALWKELTKDEQKEWNDSATEME